MKNKIFIVLFFVFLYGAQAQVPEMPKNFPSPNVFSFMQHTRIPISNYSGLPQVSIPIVNVSYKDLNIPIEISYQSSGFKPEQHPGWVGLGWNLNAGGVITRRIRGAFPDEFDFQITPNELTPSIKMWTRNGFLNNNGFPSGITEKILKESPLFMHEDSECCLVNNKSNPCCKYVIYSPLSHNIAYYANSYNRYAPRAYGDIHFPMIWLGGPPSPKGIAPSWFDGGGKKDAFSDEYSFSFMGISGKFVFRGSAGNISIDVQCNQKVKVEVMEERLRVPFDPVAPRGIGPTLMSYLTNYSPYFQEGNYPKTFAGFIITTENGTRYYFGKNAEMLDDRNIQNPTKEYFNSVGIEYSINTSQYAMGYWTADSWHLTRVLCADGRKVDFNYERKELVLNEFVGKSAIATGRFPSNIWNSQLSSPVYLKSIRSDFFNCDFSISKSNELRPRMITYSNNEYGVNNKDFTAYVDPNNQINWYKLDSVSCYGNNIPKKRIMLEYNNSPNERLFLKRVTEHNGIGNGVSHELEYDESLPLPSYTSVQTDHWGYWNGRPWIELDFSNLDSFLTSKECDHKYTLPGMLKKVKYPTGGELVLEYEGNSYSKYVQEVRTAPLLAVQNTLVGGLRIKRTVFRDPQGGKDIEKKYFYTLDYNSSYSDSQNSSQASSGIRLKSNRYQWEGPLSIVRGYEVPNSTETSNSQFISDQSLLVDLESYHVGYSKVFEVEPGNGYSVNLQTDYQTNPDGSYVSLLNGLLSPYTRYSDRSFERGLPLGVFSYGADGRLLSATETTYKPDRLENGELPFQLMDEGSSFPMDFLLEDIKIRVLGSTSKFYTHRYVKDREVNTTYFNGQELVSSKRYFYDNPLHGQVTRVETTTSEGEVVSEQISYPGDYSGFLASRMMGRHLLNTVIDRKTVVLRSNGSREILSGELFEYKLMPGNSQDFWLKRVHRLNLERPLPFTAYTGFTIDNIDWLSGKWTMDARYREVWEYDSYDRFKNPKLYIKDKVDKTSILYSNSSTLPSMININKYAQPYQSVAYTSFERLEPNWSYLGGFYNNVSRTGERSFIGTALVTDSSGIGFPSSHVELWAKTGGSVPAISYKATYNSGTEYSIGSPTLVLNNSGWSLYRYTTPNNTPQQTLTINSNGNYIDEVRVFPVGTYAKTLTYNAFGIPTHVSDENNKIIRYEYDDFGRLAILKDHFGDIVKSYVYSYRTSPSIKTYRSASRSQAFTRNNCPSGQAGSTLTYTVPEGAYSATSQASADALAAADIAANGQNYANANGQCLATFNLGYSVPSGRSFLLELRNVATGKSYYYSISNTYGTITDLPQGTYSVSVNESNYQGRYMFYLGGKSLAGTRVGFPDMAFTSYQYLYVTPY